jgi:uncharacterized protein (UPF0276 family)
MAALRTSREVINQSDAVTEEIHWLLLDLHIRATEEIHFAGGDKLGGFFIDSHSGAVPAPVW